MVSKEVGANLRNICLPTAYGWTWWTEVFQQGFYSDFVCHFCPSAEIHIVGLL